MDLFNLNISGSKKEKKWSRFISVVIDENSNVGWTVPCRNHFAQTMIESFANKNEGKPKLKETDDCRETINKRVKGFLSFNSFRR